MKTVAVALCLALCATVALGGHRSQCRNVAECRARASLRIVIRGEGRCTNQATAYCSAVKEATKDCRDEIMQRPEIRCLGDDNLKAAAKCFAGVAVQAYTKAAASLDCRGRHVYGCANADASAKAVACSIAQAVIDMVVTFTKDSIDPVCDAAIDVLIPAIAKAATYSRAGRCRRGRAFFADHDHDYAAAIEIVFAKALAECLTYCDADSQGSFLQGDGETGVIDHDFFTLGDGAHASTGRG